MADRKEEIIQAGINIFSKKGYYNTHIAEIVETVGIAKGTFYLYFNSKKDLFISLIRRFEEIFSNVFNVNEIDHNSLKLFFCEILENIFSLYKEHENLSIIILREAVAVNEEFGSEFKKLDQKRFQQLEVLYKFLLDNDFIDQELEFEYFACTFIGIMESIVMRRLLLTEDDFNAQKAGDKISTYLAKALSK